jgi:uncharacterized protein YkwD
MEEEMNVRSLILNLLVVSASWATTGADIVATRTAAPLINQDLLVIEHNVIAKTNAERGRFGLAPLWIDMTLVDSARRHATWMARNRRMEHAGGFVAENIAMGQNSSSEVLQSWMNSSGHRANILNPSYRRIGAAAFRGRDGRIYWCQQFLQ